MIATGCEVGAAAQILLLQQYFRAAGGRRAPLTLKLGSANVNSIRAALPGIATPRIVSS
jgi:hypothetical protein